MELIITPKNVKYIGIHLKDVQGVCTGHYEVSLREIKEDTKN